MCGICGVIQRDPLTPEQLIDLTKLNNSLVHRGPDGTGEYHNRHVALSMRRLSIIDLTGGWQPLYNEDRSLVLIANGEIYNYVELRKQLQARGHHFDTGSDCETILHLYEDFGIDCVRHLRGMFAFALWNNQRQQLILARDRMGEKPLYIYEQEGQLIFSSELKALLDAQLVPFELVPSAIDFYFHYQYVPEPATPIKNVRKLSPGHIMTIDLRSWQVEESCYWRMEDAPPLEGEPASLIRAELEKISSLIIRADVPVGIALSGGLDSSAIAALTAKKHPGTMHAFSVGYPGQLPNDERKEARALADYLAMPFHEVELATSDMVALFPKLVYWRDDPIADISGYGYYAVMQLARQNNVPVMLQGQGGDELFWGYGWLRQAVKESFQKSALKKRGWRVLPSYIYPEWPERFWLRPLLRSVRNVFGVRTGWERFQYHRKSPANQFVFYDLTPDFRMASPNLQNLYTSKFVDCLDNFRAESLFTFPHPWPPIDLRLTRLVCETYLLENGIAQGDRLSMASSVELRLPFVDYHLVETVIGLRKSQPDHRLPAKAWLKMALQDVLPDWVMNRPKRGFAPPVLAWHQALFEAYGSMLSDGYLVEAGILTPESACGLAKGQFPSGAIVPLSFKALVLEIWCRAFLPR